HPRASFDSGSVVPQSTPAVARAAIAGRRSRFMNESSSACSSNLPFFVMCKIMFSDMAIDLDNIDVNLLTALQADADQTNVELARLVGLSPAATLHRVRRLKEWGVIRVISARLDPAAAGFPLHVYVAASLARHDPRSTHAVADTRR